MKVVVQRVSRASVRVKRELVGQIDAGLLLLIGIAIGDTEQDVLFVANKCANLRIFEDNQGKMNLSVLETGGSILAISQFTLLANAQKGRRPSFIEAAPVQQSEPLYNRFVSELEQMNINVATGQFGAMMEVELVNSGPVTIILDSKNLK